MCGVVKKTGRNCLRDTIWRHCVSRGSPIDSPVSDDDQSCLSETLSAEVVLTLRKALEESVTPYSVGETALGYKGLLKKKLSLSLRAEAGYHKYEPDVETLAQVLSLTRTPELFLTHLSETPEDTLANILADGSMTADAACVSRAREMLATKAFLDCEHMLSTSLAESAGVPQDDVELLDTFHVLNVMFGDRCDGTAGAAAEAMGHVAFRKTSRVLKAAICKRPDLRNVVKDTWSVVRLALAEKDRSPPPEIRYDTSGESVLDRLLLTWSRRSALDASGSGAGIECADELICAVSALRLCVSDSKPLAEAYKTLLTLTAGHKDKFFEGLLYRMAPDVASASDVALCVRLLRDLEQGLSNMETTVDSLARTQAACRAVTEGGQSAPTYPTLMDFWSRPAKDLVKAAIEAKDQAALCLSVLKRWSSEADVKTLLTDILLGALGEPTTEGQQCAAAELADRVSRGERGAMTEAQRLHAIQVIYAMVDFYLCCVFQGGTAVHPVEGEADTRATLAAEKDKAFQTLCHLDLLAHAILCRQGAVNPKQARSKQVRYSSREPDAMWALIGSVYSGTNDTINCLFPTVSYFCSCKKNTVSFWDTHTSEHRKDRRKSETCCQASRWLDGILCWASDPTAAQLPVPLCVYVLKQCTTVPKTVPESYRYSNYTPSVGHGKEPVDAHLLEAFRDSMRTRCAGSLPAPTTPQEQQYVPVCRKGM